MLELRLGIKTPEGIGDKMLKLVKAAMFAGSKAGGEIVASQLRINSMKGPLFARTGLLGKSWKPGALVEMGEMGAEISIAPDEASKVAYAAIHEEGGRIVPVNAKALTIPTKENMTAARVPRYPTVADLKQAMGKENVFKPKGKNYIALKTGKKTIKPMFILAASVEIKPTWYVSIAAEEAAPKVQEIVQDKVNDAISK